MIKKNYLMVFAVLFSLVILSNFVIAQERVNPEPVLVEKYSESNFLSLTGSGLEDRFIDIPNCVPDAIAFNNVYHWSCADAQNFQVPWLCSDGNCPVVVDESALFIGETCSGGNCYPSGNIAVITIAGRYSSKITAEEMGNHNANPLLSNTNYIYQDFVQVGDTVTLPKIDYDYGYAYARTDSFTCTGQMPECIPKSKGGLGEKCDGDFYYECSSNFQWNYMGIIDGKCGIVGPGDGGDNGGDSGGDNNQTDGGDNNGGDTGSSETTILKNVLAVVGLSLFVILAVIIILIKRPKRRKRR